MSTRHTAFRATLHCLTGCAIGEVLGLVLGTAFGWHTAVTLSLAIGLAFVFGYSLSLWPVVRSGVPLARALRVVLAADTLSITVMEITDSFVAWVFPGAMNGGLHSAAFWLSMPVALAAAFAAAYPVNRYLLSRGKGHALIHQHHIVSDHPKHYH